MKRVKLLQGDNMSSLKKLPDNSIDSVVTDGPYGLSFMNKKWDYDVPSVEFWKEVYRVLKPGGHVLSFGGTRTYHRMVVNIEDAGFEIRDQIMWLYGSGFPKSHNIGKAVDKLQGNEREEYIDEDFLRRNPSNNTDGILELGLKDGIEAAKRTKGNSPWEGWGTALKPSNEPICVARKPLSEKSVAENVLKWGTGGINIDGCRVGSDGGTKRDGQSDKVSNTNPDLSPTKSLNRTGHSVVELNEGRFPANIILECICDEVIKGEKGEVKKSGSRDRTKHDYNSVGNFGSKEGAILAPDNYNDKGDIHTNPMCPCYLMDEQSGFSKTNCKAGIVDKSTRTTQGAVFVDKDGKPTSGHKQIINASTISDSGGASRFFYQAKVSKAERNMGLDGFEDKENNSIGSTYAGNQTTSKIGGNPDKPTEPKKNSHPTVKPVSLMAYLCRLVTPPNGIVLDPFMGSGSTGIAAQLEGFRFCGMEMDEDYFKIAEARIENYESYRKFIKK
jgi:site-specific DNA-methyltransferase (adenine-specific)